MALVDQFAADAPVPGPMYRIEGGNDTLARRWRGRSAIAST